LKNNGFDVVNLGIKVPPEELIKAFQTHKPDAIGLSGLLVKSAQQMIITASDLKDAGINVPLLVGGAALSARFTEQKIAPSYQSAVCYAKDAMTGLRLMNELMDPATRARVISEHTSSGNGVSLATTVKIVEKPAVKRSPKVRRDLSIPEVATLERKCGWCRTCASFGATSTRSCSMGGTWGIGAISRSIWRRAKRKR